MARRTFDVVDITEILVHWHAGRRQNEIAQSLGVDRKTARKYIAAAEAAGSARRAGRERGGVGGAGPGVVPGAG
jgi:transposase